MGVEATVRANEKTLLLARRKESPYVIPKLIPSISEYRYIIMGYIFFMPL
jgi:hypothetical protein